MGYVEAPNLFIKDAHGKKFAYREVGKKTNLPLILLTHLSANLDNWDPKIVDGLARKFWVIAFDGQGVGLSGGSTPKTILEMANETVSFIQALGLNKVHILGLSMGGMVAQEIVLSHPKLVERLVLVGTGPKGGQGIGRVAKVTNYSMLRALITFKDIKYYLFFTSSQSSRTKAKEYLIRLKSRKKNRDKSIRLRSYNQQLKAIKRWSRGEIDPLEEIKQPTLIINGDTDIMVPTANSYDLAQRISDSKLIIYKDSGHGSLFQYPEEFVADVGTFLTK